MAVLYTAPNYRQTSGEAQPESNVEEVDYEESPESSFVYEEDPEFLPIYDDLPEDVEMVHDFFGIDALDTPFYDLKEKLGNGDITQEEVIELLLEGTKRLDCLNDMKIDLSHRIEDKKLEIELLESELVDLQAEKSKVGKEYAAQLKFNESVEELHGHITEVIQDLNYLMDEAVYLEDQREELEEISAQIELWKELHENYDEI